MKMRDLSGSGESSALILFTSLKLATTVLVLSTLGGCAWLDMKEQDASARALMHSGTVWEMPERAPPPAPAGGMAANTSSRLEEIKEKYVYGKELRLGAGKWWSGQNLPVEMCVINQALICGPPPPDENDRVQCGAVSPVTDGPLACGARQKACADTAMGFAGKKGNFVGVIENEFCIVIGIVEMKDVNRLKDNQPTDIGRDSLSIQVFPETYSGPGGPGIIPVPPRPNFRNPIAYGRTDSSAD